jgi:hypothetical protein
MNLFCILLISFKKNPLLIFCIFLFLFTLFALNGRIPRILAPWPDCLCIFVMHPYLAKFFNKVHDIRLNKLIFHFSCS